MVRKIKLIKLFLTIKDSTINITLPNAEAIMSNLQGDLALVLELSMKAQRVIVLPKLQSSSLLSLAQLYDDNYEILLN